MVSAMSPLSYGLSHLLHYAGFAVAFGGSIAARHLVSLARQHSAAKRAGVEIAARKVVVGVELIGLFVSIAGGIYALVLQPNLFTGWLHAKLTLVLALLVVSHLRMFKLARLVREREAGASEAECEALLKSAATLGLVDALLFAAIFIVATMRGVLFGGAGS